jgi:hypothetical protein
MFTADAVRQEAEAHADKTGIQASRKQAGRYNKGGGSTSRHDRYTSKQVGRLTSKQAGRQT